MPSPRAALGLALLLGACDEAAPPASPQDAGGDAVEGSVPEDRSSPVDRPAPSDLGVVEASVEAGALDALDVAPVLDGPAVDAPSGDVVLDAPSVDARDAAAAADTAAPEAGSDAGALRCGTLPFDTAALLRERVGFGRAATGGDPGTVVHVRNTNDSGAGSLREALESATSQWIVFDIGAAARATITLRSTIRARSNKTLDGRGRDVVIDGSVEFRSARNIIVTDLGFTNTTAARCTQDGDVLSLRGPGAARAEDFETRDIWLHHLAVFNGGDGLLDIRGGSRVTVSWSHFHTHEKGMLFSMESAGPLEGREMEVTLHHNFFDRITRRGPQVTYGRAHFFNNYQFEWWEFGAASLVGAQFASEANVYEARPGATCGLPFVGCRDPNPCGDSDFEVSKIAVSNSWATSNRGYVSSVGDLLLDDARVEVNEPARVFRPSDRYAYTAEPATPALAERVRAEAGPRVRYCR